MDQYFNLHLSKQFILGDVAPEMIMSEPLGSCVYSQSLRFKVRILLIKNWAIKIF